MYKINCCDVPEYVYIGCTTNFKVRKSTHKYSCINTALKSYNRKLYKTIRSYGGWVNWHMTPIETYNCETKMEARMRETELMNIYKSSLNSAVAYLSPERAKENSRKYHIEHKDSIMKQRETYRNKHRDILREKDRMYRENNRDLIRERCDLRRERKRDKIRRDKLMISFKLFREKIDLLMSQIKND